MSSWCSVPYRVATCARVVELAEALLLEADGERPDRVHAELVHEGDDAARVEAARQEHAERHVAHQMALHGPAQRRHQLRLPVGLGARLASGDVALERPVASRDGLLAGLADEDVAGCELRDAGEDRRRTGDVPQREVVVQRLRIELGIEPRREQALGLRAPDQAITETRHVERLDADAIAAEHQTVRLRIPDGEGEHAVEPRRDVDALLLVEMRDHLDVGVGAQHVAACLELPRQLGGVVDLAVADHLDRAVLVAERLLAAGNVDDGEPAHPEGDLAMGVLAERVRAAVHHDVAHRAHPRGAGSLSGGESHLAGDPAHGSMLSSGRQPLALERRGQLDDGTEARAHPEPWQLEAVGVRTERAGARRGRRTEPMPLAGSR